MISSVSAYEKFKISLEGLRERQSKSCWLFHSWEKWTDFTKVLRYDKEFSMVIPSSIVYRQSRRCSICNMLQMRDEEPNK